MNQDQLQAFCEQYFHHVGAQVQMNVPGYMEVELPIDVDKELTDRPFYWMWIEATGQTPANSVLRLTFDVKMDPPEGATEGKVELITLGSFRLNKIFDSIAKRGRITRQYQKMDSLNYKLLPQTSCTLKPWLLVPYKVSFIADRRRDEIRSIAIDLSTGQIEHDFYPYVKDIPFSNQPTEDQIVHKPNHDPLTAWGKIKQAIAEELSKEDCSWAEEAAQRLQDELEQLETYYESLLLGASSDEVELIKRDKDVRIQELKWRTQPKIQVEPIFIALLYLDPTWVDTQLYERSDLA